MGGPGLIDGESHGETDNFAACVFHDEDGVEFGSAEQYFQYQKCVNEGDRKLILQSGIAADVWSASRRVKLHPLWEAQKVRHMYNGNKLKFDQNPELARALMASEGKVSFGASSAFWCRWNARIMERLRAELRVKAGKPADEDLKTVERVEQKMEEYEREMMELIEGHGAA